ncbi:hypothetical protein J4437_06980 [Candidatus Woesearchaeota archaeon]|nr:hypothetical protein [Candidatus Woesearchaeota archaeon]
MRSNYELLKAPSVDALVALFNQYTARPGFALVQGMRQEGKVYSQIVHTLVEDRICGSSSNAVSLDKFYSNHPDLCHMDIETMIEINHQFGREELYRQFGPENPLYGALDSSSSAESKKRTKRTK